MMDYRNYCTSAIGHATEILLGPEFEGLESLINCGTASFVVDTPAPTTCGWCGELLCSIRFPNGRWVNVEVFADKDSALRADLLHEHRCEPAEPWEGDGQ